MLLPPKGVPDHTLGYGVADWIETSCAIPDGEFAGQPFSLTGEQLRFVLWFYAVDGQGKFLFRRALLIRPQKWGKGPLSAAIICAEAAGPVRFDGWAGEMPIGRPWATPWIQVVAVSEDQTDNVWTALVPMIELGALKAEIPDTGKTRINVRGAHGSSGVIEPVTSAAISRLGQRLTFANHDEALALDTPLPTPSGWKNMGDARVGDEVFDGAGMPTHIEGATAVQYGRECFEVEFEDGTSVVTSDGHLWDSRIARMTSSQKVRTTGEMYVDGRRFRVPSPGPRVMPDADLPLHPYALGLWLGDGSRGQAYITAGAQDIDRLRGLLLEVGIPTGVRHGVPGSAAQISLSSQAGFQARERPAHAKALQSLPCYTDKHVPERYLLSSIEQRTALVQGLMDSDGHVANRGGQCTFVGNERLSADLVELLRSLGQVAVRRWRPDARSREGGYWRVTFTPRGGLVPVRLPRKVDRLRSPGARSMWVSIKAIRPVASVPVRCISVRSSSHLFLAGPGGHVTHNTHSWTAHNGGEKLADTQRRNLAGMGGRSLETTNAWDPSEGSVAQVTYEANLDDVLIDYPLPPAGSIRNKQQRRKVLKAVYGQTGKRGKQRGSWWVDLGRISAEIDELLPRDPNQAERFFANRIVAGADKAFNVEAFAKLAQDAPIAAGRKVVAGFDGSKHQDATGLVVTDIETGHQVVAGVWERPKDLRWDDFWEVPASEVNEAVDYVFSTWDVWRLYGDPPYWQTEMNEWAGEYGEERVVQYWTNNLKKMAYAIRAWLVDWTAEEPLLSHDGNEALIRHVGNSVKRTTKMRDPDDESFLWVIRKDGQKSPRKIDLAMGAILSWEARGDAIEAGVLHQPDYRRAAW